MKLIVSDIDGLNFPQEFKSPNYYINNLGNSFTSEIIKSGDSYYSAEIKVNQLNFFVGANNAGKSRFLRGLIKLDNYKSYFSRTISYLKLLEDLEEIEREALEVAIREVERRNFFRELQEEDSLIYNINYKEIGYFNETTSERLTNKINILKDRAREFSNHSSIGEIRIYIRKAEELVKELNFTKKNKISKKTYIPVLRSLLENEHLGKESFNSTVKKVFFENKDFPNHININTGLNLWVKIDEMQGTPERENIEEFADFLSIHFFENKKVKLLANNEAPQLIAIAIEKNKTFKYRDVNTIGDGIQTIILLLFPIFTAERDEVFYIEEPEANLHPGFQRIFIETLLTNEFILDKNLKFFFTTHSNHFLDLTLRNDQVSFFQFKKIEEGKHIIKKNIKPDKEILDELGVNNSSVFLANTSLWVEGPTDRKYLAKFLRLYCKHENKPYLKEDIDFAFFEYGGNLIAHYLFNENEAFDDDEIREHINAFANANKIYLLADNDNVKEGSAKKKRQKNLESLARENSYFKYQNTIVKEIENLLPVEVLKDFIPELLKTESSKKIAKEITFKREEYLKKGIGQFYEDLFKEHNIEEKDFKVFKVQNGTSTTLKGEYKNKLANFVIDGNCTYEDLTKDNDYLKDLIEGLYNFIKNGKQVRS